jgi:hypothetical protein
VQAAPEAPAESQQASVSPSPGEGEEEVAGSPQRAPITGEKAPLAEAGDPLSSIQRAETDAGHDFPPLEVARQAVQRHAGHDDEGDGAAGESVDTSVQRAPEPATAGPPVSGFDSFLAAIQRSAETDVPAVQAAAADPLVQRAVEGTLDVPRSPVGPLAPRLDLPRTSSRSRSRSAAAPSASAGPGPSSSPVQASPFQRAAEAVIRALPLVGKRPLTPLQRSSDDVPGQVRTQVERHVDADLGGVKIHRTPETSTTAKQLSARAYTTGGEVHVPTEHGPLDREPGRSLIAHELVHVAQQRKIGPTSIPREDSSEGKELETHAQSVERMVASDQPLPLARPHTQSAPLGGIGPQAGSGSTWTAPGMGGSAAPALQLAPEPVPAPVPAPVSLTVQRAVSIDEMSVSAGEPAQGANPGQPAGAAPAAAGELTDEQLHQAYEYFEERWRDRLWVERDLMGRRVDLS